MSEKDNSKYNIYRENLKDTVDNYDSTRYELEHYGDRMTDTGLEETLETQKNRMNTIKDLKGKLEGNGK